jgi:hypothetical protein
VVALAAGVATWTFGGLAAAQVAQVDVRDTILYEPS